MLDVDEVADIDEVDDDETEVDTDDETEEETEDEELTLAELEVDEEDELDEEVLVIVVEAVVFDRVSTTPPTATMTIITIIATMATILETAFTFLAKRALETKIFDGSCPSVFMQYASREKIAVGNKLRIIP